MLPAACRAVTVRVLVPGCRAIPLADHAVVPVAIQPVGDLLAAHAAAAIELRVVPSLWPLHDLAVSDRWDFSIVRMGNAQPR